MTNSEKLLSSFSENYFYKELVYSQLKFVPDGGTEIELADLIINLEDVILAIQLIIPGLFEPPVRTLRATILENESHIFR